MCFTSQFSWSQLTRLYSERDKHSETKTAIARQQRPVCLRVVEQTALVFHVGTIAFVKISSYKILPHSNLYRINAPLCS
jgi:uncharacterized protein YqiB (DUF1249 family)